MGKEIFVFKTNNFLFHVFCYEHFPFVRNLRIIRRKAAPYLTFQSGSRPCRWTLLPTATLRARLKPQRSLEIVMESIKHIFF